MEMVAAQHDHDYYSASCNEDSGTDMKRSSLNAAAVVVTRMEEAPTSLLSASSPAQNISSHDDMMPSTTTTSSEARHEQIPQKEDGSEEKQNQQPRKRRQEEQYTISFFPQNQAAWVRTMMTSLLGLLVVSLIMSLIVMPQYALIIILFWFIIMSAFSGLACILQNELQRKDNGGRGSGSTYVFHPLLHAMARAMVDEIEALQDEWRQEILLIKADESISATSTPYVNFDNKNEKLNAKQHGASVPFPRPKKKSKLFRIFVKPFLRSGRNGHTTTNKSKRNSSRSSRPISDSVGGDDEHVAPPEPSALF